MKMKFVVSISTKCFPYVRTIISCWIGSVMSSTFFIEDKTNFYPVYYKGLKSILNETNPWFQIIHCHWHRGPSFLKSEIALDHSILEFETIKIMRLCVHSNLKMSDKLEVFQDSSEN